MMAPAWRWQNGRLGKCAGSDAGRASGRATGLSYYGSAKLSRQSAGEAACGFGGGRVMRNYCLEKTRRVLLSNPDHTSMPTRLRHIAISQENYDRLKRLGFAGDSFNDVLTALLDGKEGAG